MPVPTASPANWDMAVGPLVSKSASVPATGKVTVWNAGKADLNVTATTLHLAGKCGKLQVTPSHFFLAAHTHETVTVTDNIPNADLAARFEGTIPGSRGISTTGAMASRFVTGHPAGTGTCVTPKAAPLHTVQAGTPWWIFAAVAVAVILAVVVVRKIRKGHAS